jgi:hypothetical protein
MEVPDTLRAACNCMKMPMIMACLPVSAHVGRELVGFAVQ